jgi:hypothetical protein
MNGESFMDPLKPTLVARQIARVNRRLFVQIFLNRLMACWVGALVLAAIWFLVEPLLFDSPPVWLRWTVAGSLVGLATLLGGLLAALAAPSRVFAALSLDEQFGLKERVTTSLMLTPEQQASPAGQALLEDVQQRVAKLDIPEHFPIRVSWVASLVPALALVLTLVALFYEPPRSAAKVDPRDELKQPPTNKAEINEKFAKLKKKAIQKRPGDEPQTEKAKEFEAELDKIASRPRDTRDQLRQRMAEMQKLEDDIKERKNQQLDKSKSIKQQLQQLDRQAQKSKDGPTRDLEKALAQGDMNKAKDEMDKLAEKMRNNELTDKEKQDLKDKLDQMKDQLQKLAQNKDKEEELKKLAREGKMDKETLQRELDRLKQENEKLQDLANLADQLAQARDALEKGDSEGAADKLKGAANQLKQMDLTDTEIDELNDQLQRLRDAKKAADKGDKAGDKEGDGDGEGKDGKDGKSGRSKDKGNGKGDTDEPNDGGIGEGRRPLGKEQPYTKFDGRQGADFNPKGKKIHDGFAPGQNFKSKPGPEIAGEVRQAAQEAPEAIEQQKIPKAARDLAKGYFKGLGGQDEKPAIKPPDDKAAPPAIKAPDDK